MTSYIAFLRGIMPMNPNMRNAKLREVFEELGFFNVQTVISSGNVIFESKSTNIDSLETKIEKALTAKLGFESAVMIRSQAELQKIIEKDPFKNKKHGRNTYLIVTFLKTASKPAMREIFNVLDLKTAQTSNFMSQLEKQHGKLITTRTWKTVQRIVEKMETAD